MRHRDKPAAYWYFPAVLLGLLWILAAALAGSVLLWKLPLSGQTLALLSAGIWCLGAYRAGCSAGTHIRRHGLRTGLICGLLLCILAGTVCFFIRHSFTPEVLKRFLFILAASGIGGIRGVNRKVKGAPK